MTPASSPFRVSDGNGSRAKFISSSWSRCSLEKQTRNTNALVRVGGLETPVALWQVQEAKARLSEVIEKARTEGPQTITRHGAERVVVLSIEDYRALVAHKPDFKAHLLGGPKVDDLTIEREREDNPPPHS